MSSVFDLPLNVLPGPEGPRGFGPPVERKGFTLRLASGRDELRALERLRALCFRGDANANDADRHDAGSAHLWIARRGGLPMATLRLSHHTDRASLLDGYSAGFFDLTPMARLQGSTMELGRLCLHPRAPAAEMMRLIWTGIARMSAQSGAQRLIGVTSLGGADPARHRAVLAHLAGQHLGPEGCRPAAWAQGAHRFGHLPGTHAANAPALPPILRFYMSLGGWVSDQLAIDRELDTCILFTCVEIAGMPAARQRLMRALADAPGDESGT